jgi:hypothetical protein
MNNQQPPSLWMVLLLAFGPTVSGVGFVLQLIGHPTWGLRVAALGVVVLVLVLLAVWYWGFNTGTKQKDDNADSHKT